MKFHTAFSFEYPNIPYELQTEIRITKATIFRPNKILKDFKVKLGIWDTGATSTVINKNKNIPNLLKIKPIGKTNVFGVNSSSIVDVFIVDILLPNKVLFSNVRVTECELYGNYDLLIGMDIIQKGDFSIANGNGKTLFSFSMPPHERKINLVERANKLNDRKKKKRF